MTTIQAYEEVPADSIEPLHGVHDEDKLAALVESMQASGWQGRPILVMDDGNGLHALSGSHRLAAAVKAGILVPVVTFESPLYGEPAGDNFDIWGCSDDEDRLAVLQAALDAGKDYEDAVALMAAEVAANDQD